MSINRVGVIGAGIMGAGIAELATRGGVTVRLRDVQGDALTRALRTVPRLIDERGRRRRVPARERDAQLARLHPSLDLAGLGRADFAMEAVIEDLDVKRRVFAELEVRMRPDAVLATNTSGLRVTDIADGLQGPERAVAMHFWNPAHLMPLVEVGAGEATAPATVEAALEVARAIGKTPVRLTSEVLGFLGTRMQQAVVREAIALLERGVASAEDIDLAVRSSFGIRFPVIGPLESADLSGLDVIESIHRYLLPDLDRASEPQAALTERVAAGALGTKTGRGFHDWTVRDPAEAVRRRDDELVRRLRLAAVEAEA